MPSQFERDTRLIQRLLNALNMNRAIVEKASCTCTDAETWQKMHAPSRRRADSKCSGIALWCADRRVVAQAQHRLKQKSLPW